MSNREILLQWTGAAKRINCPTDSGTIYPWSSNLKGPTDESLQDESINSRFMEKK